MDDDREYLPLSYLSQADYCLRRAALLMNERVWAESSDTAKGRAEHERVHTARIERRGKQLKLYEYNVFSNQLGVQGLCDCVEAEEDADGCLIPAAVFPVRLYPIEYKHGSVRDERSYQIQLCAEAMCLEEMYQTRIDEGAVFFITAHKRQRVVLNDELRCQVAETAKRLRLVRDSLIIPQAAASSRCEKCSIRELCMPKGKHSARAYCQRLRAEAVELEAT